MRAELMKAEVGRLVRARPFRPFALNLENGDRIIIEHPENIAFDPDNNESDGWPGFSVISRKLRHFGSFEAVTSATQLDTGQTLDPQSSRRE